MTELLEHVALRSDIPSPDGTDPAAAPPVDPGRILDLSWGIARTGALTAALDLAVFTRIAEGERTAARIAAGCGTDREATAVLLTALAALGLIVAEDAAPAEPRYRLAPDAEAFLVEGRPGYLGDLRHMHHTLNFRLWPGLADTITAGGPTSDLFADDGSAVWNKVTPYLDRLAEAAAGWLSTAVGAGLTDTSRVLDVGCGRGAYSRLLARTGAHVTAIDRADVVAVAEQQALAAGLGDRVEHRGGDLRELDWSGDHDGYDVVLFSNLLHGYDEVDGIGLLAQAAGVLRPGGRVAIFEIVPDRLRPMDNPVAAFFSLQMLMTSGGTAYTRDGYDAMLRDAGLGEPTVRRCPVGPGTLLTAGLGPMGRGH